MSMTPTEQIAWAGGLFEGEGSWHWDGQKMGARVTSCDEDIVRRMLDFTKVGSVYGPFPPSGLGKKPRWQWSVSNSTDTFAFYLGVEKYLGPRRRGRFQDILETWRLAARPRHKITRVEEWNLRQATPRGSLKQLRIEYGITAVRASQIRSKTWTIYVSGKMRGLPKFGFPMFDRARDALVEKGWLVVSPADMDRSHGENPDTHDFHIIQVLKRDFDALKEVDAMAMLPNWVPSVGANAEKVVAERLGRKILAYNPRRRDVEEMP